MFSTHTPVLPTSTPVIFMSTVVYIVLGVMLFSIESRIAVSSVVTFPISNLLCFYTLSLVSNFWRIVGSECGGVSGAVFVGCVGTGAIFIGFGVFFVIGAVLIGCIVTILIIIYFPTSFVTSYILTSSLYTSKVIPFMSGKITYSSQSSYMSMSSTCFIKCCWLFVLFLG